MWGKNRTMKQVDMNKGNDKGVKDNFFTRRDSRKWASASSLSSLHDRIHTHIR